MVTPAKSAYEPGGTKAQWAAGAPLPKPGSGYQGAPASAQRPDNVIPTSSATSRTTPAAPESTVRVRCSAPSHSGRALSPIASGVALQSQDLSQAAAPGASSA